MSKMIPPECRAMITIKSKFSVEDRVVSRKTGLPAIGYVIGMLPAYIYAGMIGARVGFSKRDECVKILRDDGSPAFTIWDDLYPDWAKKPIIFVELSEQQKSVSFEEFKSFAPDNIAEEQLKESYDARVTTTNIITYPEDDLEFYQE